MVLWQLRTFQETTEYLCLLKIALTLIWNYLICSSIMGFFGLFVCFCILTCSPNCELHESGDLCVFCSWIYFQGQVNLCWTNEAHKKCAERLLGGRGKGQYLIPLHTLMPGREWVFNVKMNNYRIPRYIPERTEKRCSESCMTMSIGPLFLTDK